ncbi:hypothetical protein NDU88_003684 [Pleurodeles waltl]|uniref:Uncharacterized protein n=1 Tax=Pleurodeles waltl TaxID=8319 RepID=A0AAV7L6L0_PLEWA|nr:hypothetical protein NDU88_003681 [Pleurodeles waltl]KAJ1083525.1 hypothetical protein NDU88_003684 [Pleurodeles waltl]
MGDQSNLVEALDSNVQYSVNKALAKALGPLTTHLKGFVCQQGWLPPLPASEFVPQNANPSGGKAKEKSQEKRWHFDDFEQFSASVLEEHGYSHLQPQASTSDADFKYPDALGSDSSSHDSSDNDQDDAPGPSKKKRQDSVSDPGPSPPKELTFDPTEIGHPRSTNWVPLPEVANYVQSHFRQGFEKEVRARLSSECPRPDLAGKVSDTQEVDTTMVNFMRKWAKDPKKGLDRAGRSCQGKLLDMSGTLTKILDLGFQAKDSGITADPDILIGWALRAG